MNTTILTFILFFSIAFQYTAVILAFRLIRLTGKRVAWSLISIALVLMTARRIIPFYHLLIGNISRTQDPFNEIIGLILSFLMLMGIRGIAPMFTAIKRSAVIARKAEEELRETTSKLEHILGSTYEGIYGVDKNGNCTFINTSAARMLGYTVEEVLGKNTHILWHNKFRDGSYYPYEQCGLEKALRTGEGTNSEDEVFWDKDGKPFPVEFAMYPIVNEQKIEGGVITFTDITRRKQSENALRESERQLKELNVNLESFVRELTLTNKELKSFSYSVAHDLRNPVKVIDGLTDFLIEDYAERLDEEGRSYLEKIKNGTRRINSIIDDMLLLSKISRQEIEIVDIDLSELARLTINELSSANPDRNVTVKIQNGLKARADVRLMSVTLGNLLGNAWKYTEKTVHPEIEFGAFEKEGQRIFFVKDNGIGFDTNQNEKLFVPFQRLHSEKEFKGIGVGLAIVERAISRLGGKIWARGEVGNGAEFYFTLKSYESQRRS